MSQEDAKLRLMFARLSEECARQGIPSRLFGAAWLEALKRETIDAECRAASRMNFLRHAIDTYQDDPAHLPAVDD